MSVENQQRFKELSKGGWSTQEENLIRQQSIAVQDETPSSSKRTLTWSRDQLPELVYDDWETDDDEETFEETRRDGSKVEMQRPFHRWIVDLSSLETYIKNEVVCKVVYNILLGNF